MESVVDSDEDDEEEDGDEEVTFFTVGKFAIIGTLNKDNFIGVLIGL